MPNGGNPTENEHFIPRVYFRGFADINDSGKALLWQYSLKTMEQIPVPVDVGDICFEKNLYEIKGSNGSFIAQNTIEKTFGKIEAQAGKVIQSIEKKTHNANCLNCPTILSQDDKSYLVIFITSLLYRDPATIESGISFLQESNHSMTGREARNFTLLNLLPLGVDPSWDEKTIIRTAINSLSGMAFQIGIADDDIIMTSDRPVVMWPPKDDDPYNRPRAVVFPLTSKLVLYLFPLESVDSIARNCFVKLSQEQIDEIHGYVAASARQWIYSRNPLTNEQMEIVMDARNRIRSDVSEG